MVQTLPDIMDWYSRGNEYDSGAAAARMPSGAPYPHRKLKETLELIFSWLSWLAVLFVGATTAATASTTVESRKIAVFLQIIG